MNSHTTMWSASLWEKSLAVEIKQKRAEARRQAMRTLSDITLMLVTMIVAIVCWNFWL